MWVVDLVFALAVIVLGVILTLSAADVLEIPDAVFQAVSAAVIAVGARLQRTVKRRQEKADRRTRRQEKRHRKQQAKGAP
jgi:membrane protein implicated in regulation of membrane protease activity